MTREATATKPTQSPSEETAIAARSLEKEGWVRRSLKVADLVPRRAAISSEALATHSPTAVSSTASTTVPQLVHFAAPFGWMTMSDPHVGHGSGEGRCQTANSQSG